MTIMVIVLGVASAVAAHLLWRSMGDVFAAPVLQRTNYRGHALPVGLGLVVVIGGVGVAAIARSALLLGDATGDEARLAAALGDAALVALGFGLLGFVDDVAGEAAGAGGPRGFRGHIGAALHGTLTTGALKLVGGVLVALAVAAGSGSWVDVGRQALLVAAAANLGNLFDRAPGRVIKVSLLGLAVVLATGVAAADVGGTVVVAAAGAALLPVDLRERGMLGDTGSNVLGAAVGLGLAAGLGRTGEWVAVAAVVALNVASDLVSFSRVIDALAPLRWLDRLGTRRRP